MSHETSKHIWMGNLMRGLESELNARSEVLPNELEALGYKPNETAIRIEEKVATFLQQRQNSQSQARSASSFGRARQGFRWNHPSVRDFAQGGDPVQKMIEAAREWALEGLEQTDNQTPADPFVLAGIRHIAVIPRESIADARIVPVGAEKYRIEFNPNRPDVRIRFSLAHELAHSIFPDCGEQIRNRGSRSDFEEHEWELEMLCNIGAAELLMPIATFPALRGKALEITTLMELRKQFQVSSEALLLRVVNLSLEACAVFAASVVDESTAVRQYRIDYFVPSRAWHSQLNTGEMLPEYTIIRECTAIGFTTFGKEKWSDLGDVHVEAVGISPYPQRTLPRVVGIVLPSGRVSEQPQSIRYVKGDATKPRGDGTFIIAHVVNDKARIWGVGFARAVSKKWPLVESTFTEWASSHRDQFHLGNTLQTKISPQLTIIQMICQHGFGRTSRPRIRYGALKKCLDDVARVAQENNASVHMPRIGTGQGGGIWKIIEQLIDETVCVRGIAVTIYDLPGARPEQAPELPGLF